VSEQPKQVFDRTQGPTEVRAAVQTQVTENDHDPWEAIEEAEGPLAVGRMRLMGVYDDRQRNRFMLRIRIPGGQINADQLDTVAGVIRDFGNGWDLARDLLITANGTIVVVGEAGASRGGDVAVVRYKAS